MTQTTLQRTPWLRSVYPGPVSGASWMHRLPAVGLWIASVAVLALSAMIEPDPRGFGTHEALGLPACSFLGRTGLPCMACGMTTAFSLAAHGRLIDAFIAQPAGAILAMFNATLFWVSGYAAVTGMSLAPLWKHTLRGSTVLAVAGLLLAGWCWKLLMMLEVTR